MKIGILSKDADTVTLVTQLADRHDCQVYSGVEGFAAACADRANLVVLDLDDLQRHQHAVTMLVQQHRPPAASKARPVVLLLCTPAHQHWLHNLRMAGADDFLVKPVDRQELALRLDLLLLAAQPYEAPPSVVEAGGFMVDLARLRITHPERPGLDATLTRKEVELALLFMQHLGRPLSRAFLQERIWGAEPDTPTRTIDTHVSRIRTKLKLHPGNGYQLATVYGYGYQLERLE